MESLTRHLLFKSILLGLLLTIATSLHGIDSAVTKLSAAQTCSGK